MTEELNDLLRSLFKKGNKEALAEYSGEKNLSKCRQVFLNGCCANGYTDLLKEYMSKNDTSFDFDEYFYTACLHNKIEVVKFLYEAKVKLNSLDSALEVAAEFKDCEIVKYLIETKELREKISHKGLHNALTIAWCKHYEDLEMKTVEYLLNVLYGCEDKSSE